ncbi:MAG: hypothetical protein GY805_39300 [Chloroflexi bacterium]|nr:hypothetical protein [Chloroflexota bacterium]
MDIDKDTICQLFELEKTAVNQDTLAERISENLRKHHLHSPDKWETFTLPSTIVGNESVTDTDLLPALEQATKNYDKIWVEISLPLADNSFSTRIKRLFHQLTVFYVNKLGQKQIKFNDRLLRVIHHLIASENEKDAKIGELQGHLAQLQKRVQELEKNQR